ncbi:MAG: hypothetical protein ACI849_001815, partial [Patiriisocius sp.]
KKPTIPKGDRTFDTVTLTEIDIDTSVFTKPRGAKVVED